ncbi:hypothetical protein BsWGS_06710 [Bradybaena similaris]
MDIIHGGHQKSTNRDVLTFAVRYLSRIHSDKTNGQEECWTDGPLDWPEYLGPWKNPTSTPRDAPGLLWKKYAYLISQVPNGKLNEEEREAFEDFKEGKMEGVKSFMRYKKWANTIKKLKDQLPDMRESHRMLIKENLQLVLSSIESTSKGPTATDNSPLPTKRKRESDDSLTSVQSKKSKTEMPNYDNYIHAKNIGTPKLTAVESQLEFTAYANQNTSESISNPYDTGAASLPSIVIRPIGMMDPLPGSNREEPSRTVSHCFPSSSVDSGTQESSNVHGTCIELNQQKLNDKNAQDKFQFTQNCQNNNFDDSLNNLNDCMRNCDDCMRNFEIFVKYLNEDT